MSNRIKGFGTLICFILIIMGLGYLSYAGFTYNGGKYFSYESIKQGLDLKGGVYIVFEAENPTAEDMKKAESILRLRLDSKNYMEATVSTQGNNKLRVEIPDVDDADTAVADIGKTAMLHFVDESGAIVVAGSDVVDANYQEYSDMDGTVQVRKPGVSLTFSKTGAEKFSKASAENIGKPIYIILDEEVISAPIVNQRIDTNTCSITGDFTMESAEYLATLIKSGALPVPLQVLEVNRVGAQLGSEALEGSLKAGVVGTILVLLFMALFYRLSGIAANIALIFFIITELIVLSIFRITLTLPGIAGIILTIGMAVDANVVIFERMKEEMKKGKTIRTSIESGFSRALPAILDGNITTLIAAFILFALGTGPIKGFAQTLILGVIISMFAAIFVTRALLFSFYKMGISKRSLYASEKGRAFFSDTKIKVVGNRNKFFIFSLFIIAVSFAFAIFNGVTGKGMFNFDVDFLGGASLHYELGEDAPVADIEGLVSSATGFSSPIVQKILGTDQVTIKIQRVTAEQRENITSELTAKYPKTTLLGFSDVSSTISDEMKQKAISAVILACVSMLIYISVRFKDIKMGVSAISALLHDVIVLMAVYIIFRVPVNNSFIAAVLTILGYSINATIIVFDRVRENRKFIKRHDVENLIDTSINQTMARSINTSLTTLLTITCVYIYGVTSVREFSFPLIIGIISGAYSSIFFAGSVWYVLCTKAKKKVA